MRLPGGRPAERKVRSLLPRVARTIRWIPTLVSGSVAFWVVYVGKHADRPTGDVEVPLAGIVLCLAAAFALDDEAAETVAPMPTPLLVRRAIRAALGVPLVGAVWGMLAWYAGGLTGPAAMEFAGMLALTLALAGIGADLIGEERAGPFAMPALLFLLASSALVSARWRPFPVVVKGSGPFDQYGRWGIVLGSSAVAFLLAGVDPFARRSARRAVRAILGRRRSVAPAVTPGQAS